MVRCTDKRCKVCPKAEGMRVLFSTVSNTPYTSHEVFTCADTSLNYCGKLYIGFTSNSVKVRFREQRDFAWKSHDFLRDHRIVPLEHSFFGLAARVHSGQLWTKFVSCLYWPGHQTDDLALRRHRTIPWCPQCSFSNVFLWSAFGTTMRCPRRSNRSPKLALPGCPTTNVVWPTFLAVLEGQRRGRRPCGWRPVRSSFILR